jgi:hypothetical protein
VSYDRLDSYPLHDQHAICHIGMFLVWAVKRDLHSTEEDGIDPELVVAVKEGRLLGRKLLGENDGKLVAGLFNAEGNAFAAKYYRDDYLDDFMAVLGSPVAVPETHENQNRVDELLDARFQRFKNPKPFWKFWA